MPYQELVLAEPELRPSLDALVVLAIHRFGLVLAVQPLAGLLLRQSWRVRVE